MIPEETVNSQLRNSQEVPLRVGPWELGIDTVINEVRVIAGEFKGRRLKTPSWDGLRPTSDKLRETLFNILAPRVEGARFLDGFAGTGAIGIEALSRGAAHVTFVERDRRASALVEENLALCGVQDRYTIRRGDVTTILRQMSGEHFDIIVLDPPYEADSTDALAAAAPRLAADGLLLLERATRREPEHAASLARMRDVRSGDSTLTLYMKSR